VRNAGLACLKRIGALVSRGVEWTAPAAEILFRSCPQRLFPGCLTPWHISTNRLYAVLGVWLFRWPRSKEYFSSLLGADRIANWDRPPKWAAPLTENTELVTVEERRAMQDRNGSSTSPSSGRPCWWRRSRGPRSDGLSHVPHTLPG